MIKLDSGDGHSVSTQVLETYVLLICTIVPSVVQRIESPDVWSDYDKDNQ